MDKVVAATQYKDSIIVVTEQGTVYRIRIGAFGYDEVKIETLFQLPSQ